MTQVLRALVCTFAFVVLAEGCAHKRGAGGGGEASELRYVKASWDKNYCGVKHARESAIRICISGWGDAGVAKTMSVTAINQWLEPLQATFSGIASSVVVDCNAPHIKVTVFRGSIGCSGGIDNGAGFVKCGDGNPIGTWLHEFGHGFACLGDTYVDTSA